MRKRRLTLAVGAGFALVIVLLSSLYFYFPKLTARFLTRALDSAGATEVAIVADRVRPGNAQFSKIAFVKGEVAIVAERADVRYSLSALLRGEIADVALESLQVTVRKPSASGLPPTKAAANAAVAMPSFPKIELPTIPLPRITIARFVLNIPSQTELQDLRAENVVVTAEDGQLFVKFDFLGSLLSRTLWKAKPPLAFGDVRLTEAKLVMPRKIAMELLLEREKPEKNITAITLRTGTPPELALKTADEKDIVRLGAHDLQLFWTPDSLQLLTKLRETRGKWTIEINAHIQDDGYSSLSYLLRPLALGAGERALSQILEIWPFPVEAESGALELSGRLILEPVRSRREPLLAHDHELKIVNMNAIVSEQAVTSINATCTAGAGQKNRKPFAVSCSALELSVMGGTLRASPFTLVPGGTTPPLEIQVEGIDLQQLLRMKQHDEFTATGTLDGKIPLRLDKTGVYIERGELQARSPGVIRYRPSGGEALANTNPGLGMAITALRDFQYSVLRAGLDYSPAGILKMRVTLEGRNPEFQNGKPVHFNINLEENILALIRSLTIAEDFSKQIDNRVQDAAGANTPSKPNKPRAKSK